MFRSLAIVQPDIPPPTIAPCVIEMFTASDELHFDIISCFPLRQESCPLGLTHPPGGLTDDYENDPRLRCARASPTANEPTKPGKRG